MDRLPDVYTVPVNNQNDQESMDSTCSLPILPTDTSSEDSNDKLDGRRWNRENIFPKVVQDYSVDKLSKSALKMRFRGLVENENAGTSVLCSTPMVLRSNERTAITPINYSPISKISENKRRASRSLIDNPILKNKRNSNIHGNMIMNNQRQNKSLHINNIDDCNSKPIQKSIAINTTLKRDSSVQVPKTVTRSTRTTATNTSAPINNISNKMLPPSKKEINNTCTSNIEQSMKHPSTYEASAEDSIKVVKDVRSKKLTKKVKSNYNDIDSDVVSPSKRNKTVQKVKPNENNLIIHETPNLITSSAQKSLQRNIVKTNLFRNTTRSNLEIDEVPKNSSDYIKNNKEKMINSVQIVTRTQNKSAFENTNGITALGESSKFSGNGILEKSRKKVQPKRDNIIYMLENIKVKPEKVEKAKKSTNKTYSEMKELDNELEELRKIYKTPHDDIAAGLATDDLMVDECVHSMDNENQVENDEETASHIPVNKKIRKTKTNIIETHDDIAVGLEADDHINTVVNECIDSMDNENQVENDEKSTPHKPINSKIRKPKTDSLVTAENLTAISHIPSVVNECMNAMDNNQARIDEEAATDMPVNKKIRKSKSSSLANNDVAVGVTTNMFINSENIEDIPVDIPVKRKRGRPRKKPLPIEMESAPGNGKSVEKILKKNITKQKPTKATKCIDVSNKNNTKPSEIKKTNAKSKRKQIDIPTEANISVNTVLEKVQVEKETPQVGDTLSIGKRIRKPPKTNAMDIIYLVDKNVKQPKAKKVTKRKEEVIAKPPPKSKKGVNTLKSINSIEDTMSTNVLHEEPTNFSSSSNRQGFKVPKAKGMPKTNTSTKSAKLSLSSILVSDAGTTATNILTSDEVNVMGLGDNDTMSSNLGVSRVARRKSQYNNTPFTLPGSSNLIEWISIEPQFKKLGSNLSAQTLRTNTLSFGQFKIMPKNKKTTSIAHRSNLSFIILEGEVLVHVYTRTALLGKSTRFYIPAGVEYCLENISEDQTVWLEYTKESCSSVK